MITFTTNAPRLVLCLVTASALVASSFGCSGGRGQRADERGKMVGPSKQPPAPPARKDVPLDPDLRAEAEKEVAAALASTDSRRRVVALEVLRLVDAGDLRAKIIQSLGDRSAGVRIAAAMAAGELKMRSAHRPLLARLNDQEPVVQVAVRYALHRLGDVRRSHDLEKTARDNDPLVRGQTAMVLGLLGEPSALKILKVLRRDRDPRVRQQAVEAMWRLGDEQGMKELVGWTYSRYVDDREFAILALARPGDQRVRPIIRNNLTTEYLELNLAAAHAMGLLASDEGYGIALEGAKSADPRHKVRAAQAFGAIGRTDAQDELKAMLRHPEPLVRLAAAGGILQLRARR